MIYKNLITRNLVSFQTALAPNTEITYIKNKQILQENITAKTKILKMKMLNDAVEINAQHFAREVDQEIIRDLWGHSNVTGKADFNNLPLNQRKLKAIVTNEAGIEKLNLAPPSQEIPQIVGKINNVDVIYTPETKDNKLLFIKKGNKNIDAAYIFSPYIFGAEMPRIISIEQEIIRHPVARYGKKLLPHHQDYYFILEF